MHIGTGPDMRSRNRPEAHAQTQTDAECLVSVGCADPATGWQWQSFVQHEKGRVVYNEEALPPVSTITDSRPEGREVVGESGVVAGSRSLSERRDEMDCRRRETESLAGREETSGEVFFSREGSEPVGRPNGGAETTFEQQTPRPYSVCGNVSVAQGPEVISSTAEVSPATRGRIDARRSVDTEETMFSKKEESHGKQGSVDAGLSAVRARGVGGAVKVEPPERRGDGLEGRPQTSPGETSPAVVINTPPPPSSGRSDGHASRLPASSDEARTSPTEQNILQAELMSRNATRQDGEAKQSEREDEKWTETKTNTDTGKTDHAPAKEIEVCVIRPLARPKLALLPMVVLFVAVTGLY